MPPYAKRLKKQVTIRLGEDVIAYFKSLGEETGIPYQSFSTCTSAIASLITADPRWIGSGRLDRLASGSSGRSCRGTPLPCPFG